MQVASRANEDACRPSSVQSLKKFTRGDEAQKLVQAFNTWAYKREQPSDLTLLKRFATRAVMRQEPLSFVLYWGKGPRSSIAAPEIVCLDYLSSMAARIATAYPRGSVFSLVLTDTHATLNGHKPAAISEYFTAVEREAAKRGFDCYLLSELTEAAGAVKDLAFETPSEETIQRLTQSAMKWFRGEGTPEDGARKYYAMNMVEKRAIELFFPSSIFVTFNGRDQRVLFPDNLPIFYMYSLRRGFSVKPWFLTDQDIADTAKAG